MTHDTNFGSFWLGQGGAREEFNRLLEYYTTEDGDFVACEFCQSLGIAQYNPDSFGGRFLARAVSNLDFLLGARHPAVRTAWPDVPPSNCSVTLIGQQVVEVPERFTLGSIDFLFLGSFADVLE